MASLILEKKIGILQKKLEAKNVKLEIAPDVFDSLLKEGFTPEYGAREMDRILRNRLNPLITKEILFGKLRQGGVAKVVLKGDEYHLDCTDLEKV